MPTDTVSETRDSQVGPAACLAGGWKCRSESGSSYRRLLWITASAHILSSHDGALWLFAYNELAT